MGAVSSANRVRTPTRGIKNVSIYPEPVRNNAFSIPSECPSRRSVVNNNVLFFSLPVDIQKWIMAFVEFRDLLSLRSLCFLFLQFIDMNFTTLNIPVRFLALYRTKNVRKFERMSSSALWKESRDYLNSRLNTMNRYGLRLHSFGLLTEKWIKESIPCDVHHVWIQSCRLERGSIRSLSPNLKQLVIKDCKTLTDAHLSQLPPSLEYLVLFKCPNITNDGIKNLSPSTRESLRHMDLTCNLNISNEIFQYLPPKLHLLELSSCKQLNDLGIVTYGLPSTLRSLSVNCIDAMTNAIFAKIPSSLTYLDLVHTSAKLNEEFRDTLPLAMKEVRLCSCNAVTKTTIGFLRPNLECLSLMHCRALWADICDSIPRHLRVLSLYGSATNEILMKIPQSVTELDLASSKMITDEGIEYLSECSHIKILRLDELKITSKAMKFLPRFLDEISISKCELIDDIGLEHLPSTMFRITALECPLITAKGIIKLQKLQPNLIVVTSYSTTRDVLRSKFEMDSRKR